MLPHITVGTNEIELYSLFNSLALYAAIIFNLCLFRRKTEVISSYSKVWMLKKNETSVAKYVIIETVVLSFLQFRIGGLCNGMWASFFNLSGNYFGLLYWSPPIFLLVCWIARVNPLKQLDLFTPSYALALIFFKFACLMQGCCRGKVCEFGFYFVEREQYEFPSQLLEMLVAVVMLLALVYMLRHPHIPGSLFPRYLIMYSVTRFFTEFTRAGTIVFLGLQAYQIQCIAGIVLGVIELLLIKKHGQQWSDAYDQKQEEYICAKTKTFL